MPVCYRMDTLKSDPPPAPHATLSENALPATASAGLYLEGVGVAGPHEVAQHFEGVGPEYDIR